MRRKLQITKSIKGCPFCGEKPIIEQFDPLCDGNLWCLIRCDRTEDHTAEIEAPLDDIDVAINNWNKRVK